MAKYMLLLHDDPSSFATMSPEQIQKVIEKYMAWGASCEAGVLAASHKLTDEPGKVMRGKAPGFASPTGRTAKPRSPRRLLPRSTRKLRPARWITLATARTSNTAATIEVRQVKRWEPDDLDCRRRSASAIDAHGLVDHLFRNRAGQMVAWLTRIFGPAHLELAEEVVQDALSRRSSSGPTRASPTTRARGSFAWPGTAHSTPSAATPRSRRARRVRGGDLPRRRSARPPIPTPWTTCCETTSCG